MENAAERGFDWVGLPVIAIVARLLCRELTFQNEYLRLENRILKEKVSDPLGIRRRGGRKQIIAPAGVDGAPAEEERRNQNVAVTVARAHRWRDLLESGRNTTVGGLARVVGVDSCCLARMLRLTLLALDIIKSILGGTERDGLSLGKLYGLPAPWDEQRRALGRNPLGTPP